MKLTIQTARPYSVILENGLLDRVGEMALQTRKPGSQAMLISETNVYPLYGERVKASLEKAGFAVSTFVFPAGEASKQLSTVLEMYSALARQGFTRTDFIVTLGGGVTGDMGGFAAATFLRGMPFLQVPTTLLSQVDASVGGKTGVDLPVGKNLVGAFHQPEAVLTDPETLATLPERFFRDGMGEVIKYGLIQDTELWEELEGMDGSVQSILEHAESIISHSCLVKRDHVVADELDNGIRLYLNFGHTIGHAIEATAGYGQVMHGEAVSMGMVQLSRVAEEKGLMPKGISQQIEEMCRKFGLPVVYENWDKEALYQALTHDKKARGTNLKLVIVPELGQAAIHQIPLQEMKDFLERKE